VAPIFVIPGACDIVIESLRHCRSARGLRVYGYVIVPTHIHLILSVDGDLSGVLRDFKKFTAKKIVELYAGVSDPPFRNVFKFCCRDNRPPTEHKVWQDGSHPELIKTEAFFRQKLDYLHANPLRRGLAVDPVAWTYSSIRQCCGCGDGPLDVDWLDW
jgi:putative transposase